MIMIAISEIQLLYALVILLWTSISAYLFIEFRHTFSKRLEFYRHDRYHHRESYVLFSLAILFAPLAIWLNEIYLAGLNRETEYEE